jgi:hypothetical protein
VLQPPTREFLRFLHDNPSIRNRIRAAPDKTLLYAGKFFEAAWVEICDLKRKMPQFADKEILPDVLGRIPVVGRPSSNLLEWVISLEKLVPWEKNAFIAWRALSGLYAANAAGAVSFYIGSGISKDKIFAANEVAVLSRNPNIDALTKEVLAYYQDILRTKQVDLGTIADINFGFIRG